jgi:putative ABC transport system substrate-binding protein
MRKISIAILIALNCVQTAVTPTYAADKTVGIATLMSHPALDDVQKGMREELAKRGWVEGKTVTYVVRNANQQMQALSIIASDLAALKPDVTVAITTPMAQAVARMSTGPVVFAAVTDPVGAGLVTDLQTGNDRVTGTSDAWPYKAQLDLIRQVLPNAKRLGVLYNPGEAASQYGIRQIRAFAPDTGFQLTEAGVNAVSEVRPVAESLVGRVDALFLSSDNTVIGGMNGAVSVAIERRIPLFVGDSGSVERGGIAAVSVGYHELGRRTGELVDRMLKGERGIPPIVSQGEEIYVNRKAAELMGVTIPDAVLRRATRTFDELGK